MKTFFVIIFSFIFFSGIYACNQSTNDKADNHEVVISDGVVEVYYFHFTRRCVSCVNVQKATEKVLAENYREDMEKGSIVYHEVNLSEPRSREIAQRLGVGRQALLVVCGEKGVDLTMHGFMLASRDFDQFKATIDEAIKHVKG